MTGKSAIADKEERFRLRSLSFADQVLTPEKGSSSFRSVTVFWGSVLKPQSLTVSEGRQAPLICRAGGVNRKSMKKAIYFTLVGIVMVAGLVTAIYLSIQPRSVPKIDYSEFVQPERIGQAMAMGMRAEFQDANILILGVWPGRREEVQAYKALIDSLNEPGLHYDVVVSEPNIPYSEVFGATQEVSLRDDLKSFEEGARKTLADGKRLVILTASPFASRLVKDNQANQLMKDGLPAVSMSAAPFPRNRVEEAKLEIPCLTTGDDTGIGSFGCAVLNKARSIYRKKKDPTKYSATLDLVGAQDYLFLLDPPVEAPKTP